MGSRERGRPAQLTADTARHSAQVHRRTTQRRRQEETWVRAAEAVELIYGQPNVTRPSLDRLLHQTSVDRPWKPQRQSAKEGDGKPGKLLPAFKPIEMFHGFYIIAIRHITRYDRLISEAHQLLI